MEELGQLFVQEGRMVSTDVQSLARSNPMRCFQYLRSFWLLKASPARGQDYFFPVSILALPTGCD